MNFIQWFRSKFNLDPHLTPRQVQEEFIKAISNFSKAGRVEIFHGGMRALSESIFDHNKKVFIIVVDIKNLKSPKTLKKWFEEYKV